QDTGLCDVPVCSVQDTIANLRSMTGDQRGMYALNLLNQHKNETELRVLENLRQAGLEMKALFAELGDEDWVQRAAADLVNISVFNLSKNIKVDGERLGELYQQLSNQTYRYNMISYWHGKLKTIEDSSVIEELILFADIARNLSTKAGDEDWVPRAA